MFFAASLLLVCWLLASLSLMKFIGPSYFLSISDPITYGTLCPGKVFVGEFNLSAEEGVV